MSRSRTPENTPGETPDRRMSVSSNHSRPEVEEAPAKRARVDEKARGKRLFGNILGTLNKFKKEDRSSRNTEAAKKREQLSERIESTIRKESTLQHEIQEAERELKSLRISTDSIEATLKQKDVSLKARHAHLKPISRFLHTSLPPSAAPVHDTHLLNPSPIPLNQGPTREPPHPNQLKPLYFLPKVLLPEQEDELRSRTINIDELITDEKAAFVAEKEKGTKTISSNRERIDQLVGKLGELRKQVKPLEIRGRAAAETDEMGRQKRPREASEMEVDEPAQDEPEGENQLQKERDNERREKEAGVVIKGDDGDVEVEY